MMMGINPMNNINPMMMGMANPMMMGMNPMGIMNPMNPMNMGNNMDMINNINMFPNNNPCMNNLNGIDNNQSKTIRLNYKNEFITNVIISKYENVSEKLKSILYSLGKKKYREPNKNEIVEREKPEETLEFLLNRGVVDHQVRVVIKNLRNHRNYYDNIGYDFNDINNGDHLQVEFEGRLIGAGGLCNFEFVDLDPLTKTKNLAFTRDKQKWRKISIGLNLFGKCTNKNCQAFNKEVTYYAGINIIFDINVQRRNIICPICSKNFLPVTMGFWKCEYQIKGEKFKNGEYEEININGKETFGNNFEYFDPISNETTYWSSLIIFTGHRQKMKYRAKN